MYKYMHGWEKCECMFYNTLDNTKRDEKESIDTNSLDIMLSILFLYKIYNKKYWQENIHFSNSLRILKISLIFLESWN